MMPISSMMPVNMFSGWLLLIVQTGIYVHEGADKERTERTRPDKRTKNKTHAFFFSALNPVLSALSVLCPLLHERRCPPFARPTPRYDCHSPSRDRSAGTSCTAYTIMLSLPRARRSSTESRATFLIVVRGANANACCAPAPITTGP